jgi:hypothetical protein
METSPSKLERLGSMDVREVAHRTQERLRRSLERARHARTALEESDERFLERLPATTRGFGDYLANRVAARFYVPTYAPERRELVTLIRRRFADWLPRIEEEAERLCAHRLEILGHGEVELGSPVDWHRDPVTGARWERRFWSDYDLVRGDTPGDAKRVHEANRHQHLPRLAKAYFLFDEERYARDVVEQILGWIDQNPRGQGVHWHSSLEIALRATSWMWALLWILPSRALDETAARRIGKSLFAQLDHVHAYPSLYTSPNTHLIGEAAALVVAGLLFVDSERGRTWLAQGARWLDRALAQQIGADGVHAELSTCYHCYALDFGLQVVALARRNRHPLPAALERRVDSMLDFVAEVTRPDGTLPLLGDDDGGRALALESTHYRDPGDLLCSGAVLFGRVPGGRRPPFRETTLWLLGQQAFGEWRALSAAVGAPNHASFPEAGYFVQRTGWRPWDSHLVFDCGGLGRLGGGHGHADALSLALFAGGRELLVDPGTFVYNGAPEWRDAFRSTGAHNTALVDGLPQSEPGGTFRWSTRASARLLDDRHGDGIDYLCGEHDGYQRLPHAIVHRRRLLFVRPDYWIVIDDFRGDSAAHEGEHVFDLLWHLVPDADAACSEVGAGDDAGGTAAAADVRCGPARLWMYFHASSSLQVSRAAGGPEPALGFVSHRYGHRTSAPVVVVRCRARPPLSIVTLLVPDLQAGDGEIPRPEVLAVRRRPEDAAGALALRVAHASGAEDVLLFSPDAAEVAAGPYRARAELAFARTTGEPGARVVERRFGVRAETFTVHGVRVLEPDDPASSRPKPPVAPAGGPGTEEDRHVRHRRNPRA